LADVRVYKWFLFRLLFGDEARKFERIDPEFPMAQREFMLRVWERPELQSVIVAEG
jgi:hypothetical protein